MWYYTSYCLLGNNSKHTENLQYSTKNFCIPFTRIHQLLTFLSYLLYHCGYLHVYIFIYTFFSYPFTHKCFWVYYLRISIFVHHHCIVKNFREFNIDSLYRFSILHFLVLSLTLLTAFFSPPESNITYCIWLSCFLFPLIWNISSAFLCLS